jgi:hypothetical protein
LYYRVTKQEEHLLGGLFRLIQGNLGDASISAQIDQVAKDLSRVPGDGWSSQRVKTWLHQKGVWSGRHLVSSPRWGKQSVDCQQQQRMRSCLRRFDRPRPPGPRVQPPPRVSRSLSSEDAAPERFEPEWRSINAQLAMRVILCRFLGSKPSWRDDADLDDPHSELVHFLLLEIRQHFDNASPELEKMGSLTRVKRLCGSGARK